jgi:hypothetical protein
LFIIQFISKQGSSKPALHADSRRFYAGFLKKSVKVPLENLRVKREEYESYKNLVVAATGERVIIVMGVVCVTKSRVSGTFVQYISCIA